MLLARSERQKHNDDAEEGAEKYSAVPTKLLAGAQRVNKAADAAAGDRP